MLTIRPLITQDHEHLLAFAMRTFIDTYSAFNTPENMRLHIEKTYNLAALQQELSLPHTEYAMVYDADNLVGYCKVRCTLNPPELDNKKHIELERLYVDEDYKGQGIGKKMINYCIQNAQGKGFETLWLGVWSKNNNAIEFYKKMKFEQFSTHIFTLGDDLQTDYLMKIEL